MRSSVSKRRSRGGEPALAPGRRRSTPTAAGYIHGLDGLRALAVVLVVVYHLWPSLLPGGFLGVDVFFVISGFLITTLLLREHHRHGKLDLRGFWRRRALRLLPALVTVVVTAIAAAWLTNADLLVDISRQVLGAFTFSTNWLEISAGTDYFDEGSPTLLNTLWSLAIEEQFYLVWPIAFSALAASSLSARRSSWLLRGVAVASAALMALLYDPAAATRVYYGADTHLFGLALGASLAFAFHDPGARLARLGWQRLRLWIGFAASAVLLALCIGLGSESPVTYRGGIFAASLCAMGMVAAVPGPPSGYTRLLEAAPLKWVGERSYGIYLWHWPVLLIASDLGPTPLPGAGIPAVTAVATVMATSIITELSFRFIETPIRVHGVAGIVRGIRGRSAQEAKGDDPDRVSPLRVGVALTVVLALSVAAVVGFAAAPERTAAQQSVEAGLRFIEAQNAAGASSGPGARSTPTAGIEDASDTTTNGSASSDGEAPDAGAAASGTPSAEPTLAPPVVVSFDPSGAPNPAATSVAVAPNPAATSVAAAPNPTATSVAGAPNPSDGSGGARPEPTAVVPNGAADASDVDFALAGDAIIGLGDSVLSGAAPAMYRTFPGIHIEATPILQWHDVPAIVARLDAEGLLRPVVILNFGTNAGLVSEDSQQALREVLDMLGPDRHVVLVTIVGISRWVPDSNATLARISADYPNTAIADWHGIIAEQPGLLHSDRTHPNVAGIEVYADLIERTLVEVLAEPSGP